MDLGHQDARAVLNPALFGVSNDQDFRNLEKALEHIDNLFLNSIQFGFVNLDQILHVLFILWVKESGWEKCIVVVEYHYVLVSPWLLYRCEPDPMVH